MPRTYTLKKRAEAKAQTRQRIVEATVDLHGSVGPAATTFTMIAERAGVQRHTLYAHFPDEQSLFMACSGLAMERDPPPAGDDWRSLADRRERLGTGLRAIYAYFARTAGLTGCVLRDAEHHEPTRAIVDLRMGPYLATWREVLGDGLSPAQQAMLTVALSFHSWRTLTRDAGLETGEAADAMAGAVVGAEMPVDIHVAAR